jgi:hypothetical protein
MLLRHSLQAGKQVGVAEEHWPAITGSDAERARCRRWGIGTVIRIRGWTWQSAVARQITALHEVPGLARAQTTPGSLLPASGLHLRPKSLEIGNGSHWRSPLIMA